ncbi:dihydrodipicolinate synthase family protein [Ensifer canadensis]
MTTSAIHDGVHAVLFALFDAQEALDHGAMKAQVDYCVETGCQGITVLGLATEVLKLTFPERYALVETTARANDGRLPLSVTIAGNSVAEQVALAKCAESARADWLILQPPMVGSYGADVYLDFFARVAASTTLPLAVQNAPQYLGRGLSGEDLVRLKQRAPNLTAVKAEDAALGLARIVDVAGENLVVVGGRGGLEMTDALRIGCRGFVLAPDIAPVAARIFDLWQAGHRDEAEAAYAAALPAATFVMQSLEHLITYGKRIFGENAGIAIHDRAPCLPVQPLGLSIATQWAGTLSRLHQERP